MIKKCDVWDINLEDLANRSQYPKNDSHSVFKDGANKLSFVKKVFTVLPLTPSINLDLAILKSKLSAFFFHGNSINSIAKALEISFPTVQKRIKKAG